MNRHSFVTVSSTMCLSLKRAAKLHNTFHVRACKSAKIAIRKPIQPEMIATFCDTVKAMMEFLRNETYPLLPKLIANLAYGFVCEDAKRHTSCYSAA